MAVSGDAMVAMPEILAKVFEQLPTLAIFIWFVLVLLKSEREEREKRDAAVCKEREKRDDDWRAFLGEQRMAMVAGLDTTSARLQQLGDLMLSVAQRTERIENLFYTHDKRAEGIAVRLAELTPTIINKARKGGSG